MVIGQQYLSRHGYTKNIWNRHISLFRDMANKKTMKKCQLAYVYFPVRTLGLSPKFTNQWRGPYKELKINSSVTYIVSRGRKGVAQVIHVDRRRPCLQNILRGQTFLTNKVLRKLAS